MSGPISNPVTEITQERFRSVYHQDLVPTYEKRCPEFKQYILSHFDYMLSYWGKATKVIDIRCVLGKDISTEQVGCVYMTKEERNCEIVYMMYPLLEKPDAIYENEIIRRGNPQEFAEKVGTLKSPTESFEIEKQAESFIRRFLSSTSIFEESQLQKVTTAKNPICERIKLTSQNVVHMNEVCKHVIKEHGLVPFCQSCGDIDTLWKFGKNYIFCKFCFASQFHELPMEVAVVAKSTDKSMQVIKAIPYSEYLKYLSQNYDGMLLEYYTLDELNYNRAKVLLYSPNFQKHYDTLSKKRQNCLDTLATFISIYLRELGTSLS